MSLKQRQSIWKTSYLINGRTSFEVKPLVSSIHRCTWLNIWQYCEYPEDYQSHETAMCKSHYHLPLLRMSAFLIASMLTGSYLVALTNLFKVNRLIDFLGFGKFSVAERAARDGRNPQTGETLKIAASKTVKFSAGKDLKDAINTKKKKK